MDTDMEVKMEDADAVKEEIDDDENLFALDEQELLESTYYYDLGLLDDRHEPEEKREISEEIEELEDHNYCRRPKIIKKPPINERRSCHVCYEAKTMKTTKDVGIQDERMIIILSRVLQGMILVEKTNIFMNRRTSISCFSHYSEAIHEIYKFLKIENYSKLFDAPIDRLEMLMDIVRKVNPNLTTISQFNDALYRFQTKNWDFIEKYETKVKLEPLESSESTSFIPEPSEEELKEEEEENEEMESYHYCFYCSELHPDRLMAMISTQKERLVIVFLLRVFFTLEQAKMQMKLRKDIYVCHSHFAKIIKDVHKLMRASPRKVNELMVTVRALWPKLHDEQFYSILDYFVKKNTQFILKNPMEILPQKIGRIASNRNVRRCCAVCRSNLLRNETSYIEAKSSKLVAMVGCILKGQKTFEEAMDFINEKKRHIICRSHFSAAIQSISKALHIEIIDERSFHPENLLQNMIQHPALMDIVKRLCPGVTMRLFRNMVVTTHFNYRIPH